jgi:RNA polymerase sigma-70 factor (ECF subfamily)
MPPTASVDPAGSSDALPTSRSLLNLARERDDTAWRRLVELYTPLVYFWCRRSSLPEQDIPDVVQDVFRAVVAGLASFRKQRAGDTFRGWLRTITRSKLSDAFRRRGRTPAAPGGSAMQRRAEEVEALPDDDDPQEQSAEQELFFRGLESIRSQFEPHVWDAFWRVVVEEQSVAEAAAALNMRPGTVRVAKCRVLQRLRQQLGDVE